MLVDTHTHLHFPQFADDRAAVIQRALAAGVERLIAVGTSLADSRAAVALAAGWPGVVYATVGVHPNAAHDFGAVELQELRELAGRPGVVAIGEVGLDYFRDHCPRPRQREAFLVQQALALELELPLVIHCREAHDDVLAALESGGGFGTRVVVHCFTTFPEQVPRFLERGCWIGMDGPVTYPKAVDAHAIAVSVPTDRLLLETDCPYLSPQRRRGQRCEPADVTAVADEVARLRGVTTDALVAATGCNAAEFFGWAQ